MPVHHQFNEASRADGSPIHYTLTELSHDATLHLEQIAGRDRVHTFGADTIDALRTFRIGGEGLIKTSFAVVQDSEHKVESVIFGHFSDRKINSAADLQGNVHDILNQPSHIRLRGSPTAIVFYSISALIEAPGVGARMINQLLGQCPDGLVPATLSPLRTLAAAYPDVKPNDFDDNEKFIMAYQHLMHAYDPVQGFHMGNGARLGDINMNANTPQSIDGRDGWGTMVNYLYTTNGNFRADCRQAFRTAGRDEQGQKVMDKSLFDPALYDKIQGLLYLSRSLPKPSYPKKAAVPA